MRDHVLAEQLHRAAGGLMRQKETRVDDDVLIARFAIPLHLGDDLVRCAEQQVFGQRLGLVFAPVCYDAVIYRLGIAFADIARVLEQVLETAPEIDRRLHRRFASGIVVIDATHARRCMFRQLVDRNVCGDLAELLLQHLDFLEGLAQGCRHDVAPMRDGKSKGILVARGDPHRGKFLQRFRHAGGRRELPQVAVMGIIALPQFLHGGDNFAQIPPAFALFHAAGHAVEFILIRPAPQTHFQPPAGQHIAQRRFPGQADRAPIGRGQNGGAQPDAFGMRPPIGEQLKRVR